MEVPAQPELAAPAAMLHRRQSWEADVYFATTRAATRKTLVSCIGVRERGIGGAVINFAVTPLRCAGVPL